MILQNILLSENVPLYNNFAFSGNCHGRLTATLEIDPSPRIVWEFESLGIDACGPEMLNKQYWQLNPFEGENFVIPTPFQTAGGFSFTNHGRFAKGVAFKAGIGDMDKTTRGLCNFYLPNCVFHQRLIAEQQSILDYVQKSSGPDGIIGWKNPSDGNLFETSIDSGRKVHFRTKDNALEWLDNRNRGRGTLVTTFGTIEEIAEEYGTTTLSLNQVSDTLIQLCRLLSFANGGHIAPIYIEKIDIGDDSVSAMVCTPKVTPLELVGQTWLAQSSSLSSLLGCFSTFQRMLNFEPWITGFDTILMWYFQAVQRPDLSTFSSPWPIVANAIGAALERLHKWVFIDELQRKDRRDAKPRIKDLLASIGITTDDDEVNVFVNIRNDATHADTKTVSSLKWNDRDYYIRKGIMWMEEALLWRLGYDGDYIDRSDSSYRAIPPRYDLSLRLPQW